MYYTSFRIRNFKGIKDTTVRLVEGSKMGVFAFVGLNESGKTTILEAIHSFSPDVATSQLVGGKDKSGVPYPDRVPRHLISNFSGDVSVAATVKIDDDEKSEIIDELKSEHSLIVNTDSVPAEILLEKHQRFKTGDFVADYFTLRTPIEVKTGKQKKWRSPSLEESTFIRQAIYNLTPDIAYFPTFVFDFPKRIFLTTERGDRVTKFYRQVFQDILDYDGQGHTIENSILRRVRSEEHKVPWPQFFTKWNVGDDREKIQHVMDRASATVTSVVFGRWNSIFGEDAKGKEVNISFEVLQGERRDQQGALTATNEHDVFVKFQIKDGTRRFDVNDRSLGFRWFFAFMLFTQFRVARDAGRPTLFLFDEPASNLHAAAQQKLIDSFPEIARGDHTLAYTTHSHYMIEPKWLEQTFIVTNRADAPPGSVIDAVSLSDESLDIQATRYRNFVNAHPDQTSYFQPILDRLRVVPSRLDVDRSSVVIEGKSDYYILRYSARLLGMSDLPLVPGLGAGTFGALVALHLGWGLSMLFIVDGDKQGKQERERYIREFGLQPESIAPLDELVPGVVEIEDLLDERARGEISRELGTKVMPSKKQISRFFQEALARDEVPSLSDEFEKRSSALLDAIRKRIMNSTV